MKTLLKEEILHDLRAKVHLLINKCTSGGCRVVELFIQPFNTPHPLWLVLDILPMCKGSAFCGTVDVLLRPVDDRPMTGPGSCMRDARPGHPKTAAEVSLCDWTRHIALERTTVFGSDIWHQVACWFLGADCSSGDAHSCTWV